MTLLLATAIANIRSDLNDLDSSNYRWTDPTITRELDRAVARYSSVSPLFTSVQIPAVAGSRIYAFPAGAWWIDRVEFPTGSYPRRYVGFHPHPKTDGTSELELDLLTTPGDATQTIEITYAGKHTLDSGGTTIPELHHDALYLGAQAYLVQQWLGNVNDNFEYVDGQFRDRVDDTKSTVSWHKLYAALNSQWEARLKQIRAEANDAVHSIAQWGDKPYRWDRL